MLQSGQTELLEGQEVGPSYPLTVVPRSRPVRTPLRDAWLRCTRKVP